MPYIFFLLPSEQFSVQAKANATNVAYTSEYLQLHTDLPYYEYKPGVRTCTIDRSSFHYYYNAQRFFLALLKEI